MKKLLIAMVISIGFAACTDNSGPSGTGTSDSTGTMNSAPDNTGTQTMPLDTSASQSTDTSDAGSRQAR